MVHEVLIVVVTATAGFRHDSIETAEGVIAQIAARRGYEVAYARDDDEMRQRLTADALRKTDVVIFANTTGEIATDTRATLLDWVANGGAFIGAHSASDTWHESPEYVDMLGGEFLSHPDEMNATLFVENPRHPATASLESPHVVFEEIYDFKNFDPARVNVLVAMHDPLHQLSWWKNYGRGRVFYTALGHRKEIWSSPWFQQHVSGAIEWVLQKDLGIRRRAAAH